MNSLEFTTWFLDTAVEAIDRLPITEINRMASILRGVKERGGRLFCIGCGGGQGHASHAAADFRRLAGIESYCPGDNASSVTALSNDIGFDRTYAEWLKQSQLCQKDCVLVISVGGGSCEKGVSLALVNALWLAKDCSAATLAIVGRDGGDSRSMVDCCVVIPPVEENLVTPITEGLQAVVLHLLVSHPDVKNSIKPKWESLK